MALTCRQPNGECPSKRATLFGFQRGGDALCTSPIGPDSLCCLVVFFLLCMEASPFTPYAEGAEIAMTALTAGARGRGVCEGEPPGPGHARAARSRASLWLGRLPLTCAFSSGPSLVTAVFTIASSLIHLAFHSVLSFASGPGPAVSHLHLQGNPILLKAGAEERQRHRSPHTLAIQYTVAAIHPVKRHAFSRI